MEVRHLGTLLNASLKDVIHATGKMPMSISITILTDSDAPIMTAQVNLLMFGMCEVQYTEKEESC